MMEIMIEGGYGFYNSTAFVTLRLGNGERVQMSVKEAVRVGVRLIESAAAAASDAALVDAFKAKGIDLERIAPILSDMRAERKDLIDD